MHRWQSNFGGMELSEADCGFGGDGAFPSLDRNASCERAFTVIAPVR